MFMKFPYNTTLLSNLKPVSATIYYENEVPYINYIGTVESNMGKLKVHIPKLGLNFNMIEKERTDWTDGKGHSIYIASEQIYIVDDTWIDFKIVERELTKEQIEKELGYKVNIIK